MKTPLKHVLALALVSCATTALAGMRVQYFVGYGLYPSNSPDTTTTAPGSGLLAVNGSHRALIQLISAGPNHADDGLDVSNPGGGYTAGDDVLLDSRILEEGVDGVDEWGYTASIPPPFVSTNSPSVPLFVRVHQNDTLSEDPHWTYDSPLIWPDDLSSDITNPPADVMATVIHIESGSESPPMTGVALGDSGIPTNEIPLANGWYVATNGNDSAAGTNWATAKLTIQAAVDAATNGSTVWVSNGVYATGGLLYGNPGDPDQFKLTNRVAIYKPITVRSVNGPEVTIIQGAPDPVSGNGFGDGAVRCACVVSNAVLSGFTLTGGWTASSGMMDMPNNQGGGAWCPNAAGIVTNCLLNGNRADHGGGVRGGTLYNCMVTGNAANDFGGGSIESTLNNCLVTGNTAGAYGGGAHGGTLNNCTVVGNTANTGGGGTLGGWLYNCIVYGNTAPNGSNYYNGTFHSSCTTPNPGGTGNTATNPLFVDAVGGNYRLNFGSPCRDAGNNAYVQGTADLDGNPRIANGTVDMGAYEVQPPVAPVLTIAPPSTNLTAGAASGRSIQVTANVTWTAATNAPWLAITSGDSGITNGAVLFSVASNGLAVSRTGAVLVAGGGLARTCTVVQAAGIVLSTHWHVATNGDDAADGQTWATAKRTIQAAIDAAAVGNTVWVSNGVYAGLVTVNKGITVRSVNGAEATTIQGASSRCVNMNHADAVIAGFTLTGGTADWGGGAYIDAGALERCVIRGNSASGRKGSEQDRAFGGGVYGGTLWNCIVSNNLATAYGDQYHRPLAQGGGTYGANLRNCLVAGNEANSRFAWVDGDITAGGGVSGGSLVNCTVAGNIASLDYLEAFGRLMGSGCNGSEVRNSIVYGNICYYSKESWGWSGLLLDDVSGGSVSFSCAPDISTDNGNLTSAPQFAENEADHYRLQTNSPCVDAGNNAYVQGTADLDGNPRISGARADMGAYEVQPPIAPALMIAPASTNLSVDAASGRSIQVTANVPWTATTNVPWLAITSGASGTTNGAVVFSVEANGLPVSRTGAVVVAGGGLALTCAVVQAAAVLYSENWYVATNGNDSAAGTNWATAKLTIQAAVDAAADGNTVWVSNGVYATGGGRVIAGTWPNRVAIDKPLTVQGVNGAETTFIKGNGMRCVWLANGASLIGFTVCNGATRSGYSYTDRNEDSGGGVLASGADARIVNCTIASNSAMCGGGLYGGTAESCLFTTNRAEWGGAVHSSSLWNCTVVRNRGSAGGGTYNASCVNSIFKLNTAISHAYDNSLGSTFSFSCIPSIAGTGNISDDPCFVDESAGNFQLRPESPCISAGDNSSVVGAADLAGNPRIANGTVEMGAYEYPATGLDLVPGNIGLSAAGTNAATVEVWARVAWAATTGMPWLSITSGESGTTNGAVVFDAANNTNTLARTGMIVVAGGGLTRTCRVVQAAFVPELSISPARTNLSYGATSGLVIGVTANVSWTAVTNAPWLAITSGTSGTADGTIVCNVESNVDAMMRTGTLVVAGGGFARTCTVVQAGFVRVLSISPTRTDLSNAATGGLAIGVTANVSWTAATNAAWLSITSGDSGPTNGTVIFSLTANEGTSLRAGTIVVAGGGLSRTCTVVQFCAGQQVDGYHAWVAAVTNGLTNDADCAIGDGVPNLLRYATGSPDPMTPDGLSEMTWMATSRVPVVRFNRNPNATDITLMIQGAEAISNGAAWRSLATNLNGSWGGATNVSESGTSNPVVCTVEDPAPLLTNRFLRLKVTRP